MRGGMLITFRKTYTADRSTYKWIVFMCLTSSPHHTPTKSTHQVVCPEVTCLIDCGLIALTSATVKAFQCLCTFQTRMLHRPPPWHWFASNEHNTVSTGLNLVELYTPSLNLFPTPEEGGIIWCAGEENDSGNRKRKKSEWCFEEWHQVAQMTKKAVKEGVVLFLQRMTDQ